MKNTCIMIPSIKKDGKEYGSKLFSDLSSIIKNRSLIVSIYSIAVSTTNEFDRNELDEFGEPKVDSVLKKFNICELFKNELSNDAILESVGLIKSGKRVYFNKYEDIINQISSFNKDRKNKLILIKSDDNGYYGEVVADTQFNIDLIEHQEYVNSLNKKMKLILNKLGFDAQRVEGLQDAGIFSPENIDKTADELINIIKLSKGIEGDYAFTEEFSHFIVSGLRKTDLIRRLLNTLNLDSIREILDDEYDNYYNKYKNKTSNETELLSLLKEEVAGKLLVERLNNNIVTNTEYNSLWERFENYVKNNFKDKDQNEILNIINETKKEFDKIRNDVLSNDEPNFFKDFDKLQIEISKDLYKIKNDFSKKFIAINEEILKINAQKKQLFSVKGNTSLVSKEDTRLDEYLKLDENLKETEKLISEKQYSANCLKFLEQVKNEIDDFFKEEKIIVNELEKNENDKSSFVRIGKLCGVLNNIKDFLDSYLSVTNDLMNLNTKKDIPLRTEISNLASLVNKSLIKMKKSYSDLQYDLVYYWLKTYYWKTNPKIKTADGEIITLTLESMLREAPRDIDVIDTWVSEMGHCSDPLLNLVSTIHKKAMAQRDIQLEDVHNRLSRIYMDLGGGPTDFMYEVKNGKLTGRFKSKYDFDKFNDDRRKFINSIDEKKSEAEKRLLIQKWDGLHTMKVLVDPNAYNGTGRYEKFPNIVEYPQYKIDNWDEGMTDAQKKYYDSVMLVKGEMETNLNFSNQHLYLAPQVTTDYLQALTSDKNLKDTAKSAFAKAKRTFIKDVSDIEYGEINENGEINIITNMHGDPIKKVPVYFVNKITDTSRLNTDCTKCMAAYSAMALNFKEMNKIINQIETLKELAFNRDVKQYKGNNLMVNNIKTGNGIIEEVYTKKGKDTNIGKRLDKYIDMNFYGMQKEEGNSIQLFGCEISLAKFSDWLKDYSGVVNLGLNTFSSVSNINVGEVQLIIEAMANSGLKLFTKGKKHTFGIKDLVQAHAIYLKELPKIMAEMGNPLKTNYLSLMMKKYDTEQTFFEDVKNDGYYNNTLERIIGNNSLGYCLQNAGEHFLHGVLMIAMLKAKKVLVDGVEMSLYDAYKVENNKLVEKGEIKELDGTKFTNNKFIEEKLRIQEISHQLNGAFSAEDLGSLHSKAILRLAAQFRQWMPGHWGRRFAKSYINTATGEQLEGYWYTAYKLVRNLSIAIRKDKTNIATVFSGMSDYEKLNLLKVLSELTIMFALSLLIKGAFAGDDDDDDELEYGGGHFGGGGASGSWGNDDGDMSRPIQFYKYQLKRTYMEVASTMPIMPIAMGENLFTMLQSPAAAIKACNNLLNIFCVWNLGDEIQSGKYEGWSVYTRDLLNAIPYFGNMRKIYDLAYEKYMFNIFP